jgi:hypothetical protein
MRIEYPPEAEIAARPAASAGRHIALQIDPSRMRRAHHEIATRLAAQGARVSLVCGGTKDRLPPAADLLLELERMIYRLRGPRPSDRWPWNERTSSNPSPDGRPDLVFDLSGDGPVIAAGRTIRLLYDGVAGEAGLLGALAAGRMPIIDMEDMEPGVIIARGAPCAGNAATMSEAFDCALARVVTLVTAIAGGVRPLARVERSAARPIRLREMGAFEAKSLVRSLVRRLYYLCCHAPHWRTCWRAVDGPDLWDTRTLMGTSWNVMPDPGFRFYADPFPFVHDGRAYVFVEDFDHRSSKGVISVIPFTERGPAGPAQPVLEEPWHLSYPFLLAHGGQIWMIPESSAAHTVNLYRADPFPHRWVREATLLSGIEASDATVIRHGGRFWMFAATRDGAGSWSDTLSIFSASDLHGAWHPHPLNPVLVDRASARPAGAMLVRNGRLYRPVQDCTHGYGTGIGLAEVVHLDHDGFEQKVHTVLRPDPQWPGRRLHTLNRAGWLECIDGSAYSPRSRLAARALETWSGRREPPHHW